MSSRLTITPICPRCGYDQSGEVAAWTDRCPLDGRCPECGTEFAWADLFDPARQDIGWLVEHAHSVGQQGRRTIPTLVRMLVPWVFWARVDIHARTRPRAVAVWILLLFVSIHAVAWLPFSILFAALDGGYALSYGDLSRLFRSDAELWAGLVTGLVWPVAAVTRSWYWIWGGGYYDGWGLISVWRFPIGMSLTWLLILAALPITRRMAALRWMHLARAMLFGMVGVVVGFSILRVLVIVAFHAGTGSLMRASVAALFLVVCVWTLVWWICAVRIGWRIRSVPLLVLGTVASVLGGVVMYVIELAVSQFIWYL